jgi:monofunctional biosynthetic peptidoglycan transglycosylase
LVVVLATTVVLTATVVAQQAPKLDLGTDNLQPLQQAATRQAAAATTVVAANGEPLGQFLPEQQFQPIDAAAVPKLVADVVTASEDPDFYTHHGFTFAGVARAAVVNASAGDALEGGSTITQQVAKNLWLSGSYNPLRKVKEAILTRQLENELSKRRILEIYLNVAEFGEGIYGAEAAARHYYHRSAAGLTDRQGAELSVALPRPRSWHPGIKTRGYQREVRYTQRRMAVARWLAREI